MHAYHNKRLRINIIKKKENLRYGCKFIYGTPQIIYKFFELLKTVHFFVSTLSYRFSLRSRTDILNIKYHTWVCIIIKIQLKTILSSNKIAYLSITYYL